MVKEYKVMVRQFLTKPNPKYPDRKPVPFRTMYGIVLEETPKAYKMTLRGKAEASDNCMRCGRTITNPTSIQYGLGIECINHVPGAVPLVDDGDLEEYLKELNEKMELIIWTGWLPKGYIEIEETGEDIEPFGTQEEPKAEEKKAQIYAGLSYAQEALVEKARLNHLDHPNKPKPIEIWVDKKGIVKLVFEKADGTKSCYKIDREGNRPESCGLPFAPKYSKVHDISYDDNNVKVVEESKKAVEKTPEPEVDMELVTALANELNSLYL